MTDRRDFLASLARLGVMTRMPGSAVRAGMTRHTAPSGGADDRRYWVRVMDCIARPVLERLAAGRLRATMPVEVGPEGHVSSGGKGDRAEYSHLEAVGRVLTGVAPWLELGADATPEGGRRAEFAELARRGLSNAVNPASADFVNFTRGQQPLVDAAFLAHAIVRAPTELWQKLDDATKANLVRALESTRPIVPSESNWLLFSAMVEAALCTMGAEWKPAPVETALRHHESWYKGDGVYGDGAFFHWDYYNSFVIQPMLLDVIRILAPSTAEWQSLAPDIVKRARRYAAIQERMISPEGTFPPIGRSLAYRFGAFQLLGQMALRHELPAPVTPAQVRCGVTAVIRRMIQSPEVFDRDGWLTIGFAGHQPSIAEDYISTGSVYLCTAGLLPLGLPADDEFWVGEAQDWTSRQLWSGENVHPDHAM